MATLKHIASKNSDYSAIEAYLIYQHDEFSGKVILDEQGRPMLRESYLLDTLECGDFSFATACLLANRKYGKNTQHGDIKSHQYIISFDPRDAADNGLTMEKAQALGLKFCEENFPGHPAIVCTHPDGHNHSGNIHVHIVIGSIRMREVERKPYMQKPRDWLEGMKHSSTAQTMRHLRVEVMKQQTVTVAVLNCINYYRSLQRKKNMIIFSYIINIGKKAFGVLWLLIIIFIAILFFISNEKTKQSKANAVSRCKKSEFFRDIQNYLDACLVQNKRYIQEDVKRHYDWYEKDLHLRNDHTSQFEYQTTYCICIYTTYITSPAGCCSSGFEFNKQGYTNLNKDQMIALASALCETNNVWKQWSLDRDGYTAWRVFLYLDEQYVQSIVASEVKKLRQEPSRYSYNKTPF